MLSYTYCPVQRFYFGLIVQQPHRTEKYDNNRSSSPTVISCWDFNWYFSFMSNTAEFCGHVLLMRARCHLWLQQYTKWESHSLGVNTTSSFPTNLPLFYFYLFIDIWKWTVLSTLNSSDIHFICEYYDKPKVLGSVYIVFILRADNITYKAIWSLWIESLPPPPLKRCLLS